MACWVKECGGRFPAADCFKGTTLCQHGDDECYADTVEACAIKLYPDSFPDFVYCFEGVNAAARSAVKPCAAASGMDAAKLTACESGSLGKKLDASNAAATAKLGAAKIGTPWVLVDGKALDDADNLFTTLCGKLSNPPAACNGA